jgi:hypothetical protein
MLSPAELHAGAWPLVEPVFEQAKHDAINRYQQLSATERAITDLARIVQSAHHGRVDTLFVPVGVQVWGQADPATGAADIHPEHQPGDEDLLDLAAIQTLTNGGDVFVVPPEELPGSEHTAAILRY